MKSKVDIEMDFTRALAQAQELETISKELSEIATGHLEGAFRLLTSAWQGDNATLFNDKRDVLVREFLNTADDLIKVSKNISSTAYIVYAAEKAATNLGFYCLP